MADDILTIQEVATYLKLNEKTAYRLASEGKLPGFKVGGSWRFKRVDLEQWIEEQKQGMLYDPKLSRIHAPLSRNRSSS